MTFRDRVQRKWVAFARSLRHQSVAVLLRHAGRDPWPPMSWPTLLRQWTLKFFEHQLFCPAIGPVSEKSRHFLKSGHAKKLRTISGDWVWTWHFGSQGPRVLLVHGWSGAGTQLRSLAQSLGDQGFQVTLVDLPGHGYSHQARPGYIEMKQALLRVVEHYGQFNAVITHSYGASVVALAMTTCRIAERLVFIAPMPDLELGARITGKWLAFVPGLVDQIQEAWELRNKVSWKELSPLNFAPQFHSPLTPLMIVHDSQDFDIPLDIVQRLQSQWPGSKLRVTDGLGHMKILDSPQVQLMVKEFLADLLLPN